MTVTSRVPALIDYLVGLFTNAATLGAAPPPNTVTVFDGPATTALDPPLVLYVGLSDPDNPAAETAADSVQQWAAIGRLGRDETITVHCCAEAWAGTDDMRTVRVAAAGIAAAAEALMQADTTQFGGLVLFPAPGITAMALMQNNTDRGAIARVAFDLVFRARIGGLAGPPHAEAQLSLRIPAGGCLLPAHPVPVTAAELDAGRVSEENVAPGLHSLDGLPGLAEQV